MRTNVTLDESMVSELLDLSGEKTKTAAVTTAVKEQIRRAKLRKLADLLGRIEVDGKALEEQENAERKRSRLLDRTGAEHAR